MTTENYYDGNWRPVLDESDLSIDKLQLAGFEIAVNTRGKLTARHNPTAANEQNRVLVHTLHTRKDTRSCATILREYHESRCLLYGAEMALEEAQARLQGNDKERYQRLLEWRADALQDTALDAKIKARERTIMADKNDALSAVLWAERVWNDRMEQMFDWQYEAGPIPK